MIFKINSRKVHRGSQVVSFGVHKEEVAFHVAIFVNGVLEHFFWIAKCADHVQIFMFFDDLICQLVASIFAPSSEIQVGRVGNEATLSVPS